MPTRGSTARTHRASPPPPTASTTCRDPPGFCGLAEAGWRSRRRRGSWDRVIEELESGRRTPPGGLWACPRRTRLLDGKRPTPRSANHLVPMGICSGRPPIFERAIWSARCCCSGPGKCADAFILLPIRERDAPTTVRFVEICRPACWSSCTRQGWATDEDRRPRPATELEAAGSGDRVHHLDRKD